MSKRLIVKQKRLIVKQKRLIVKLKRLIVTHRSVLINAQKTHRLAKKTLHYDPETFRWVQKQPDLSGRLGTFYQHIVPTGQYYIGRKRLRRESALGAKVGLVVLSFSQSS